jgi:hypothetical protein
MRKIWNAIKRFFGFGKPELEVRATEVDALIDTYKVEPRKVEPSTLVTKVPEAELPAGITVKTENKVETTGNIVTEPKGVTKNPKGISKGAKKAPAKKAKPAPEVEPDKVEEKKEAKKAPAKKTAPKAAEKKEKTPAVKRAWYNNGVKQKLIPVDQEIENGWTKGKLPKGKSIKKGK